jgi:hypothetical protein
MISKKYKVNDLVKFNKDIRILAFELRERVRINKITYDNKTFSFIYELDASDKFHEELNKLGYTTI